MIAKRLAAGRAACLVVGLSLTSPAAAGADSSLVLSDIDLLRASDVVITGHVLQVEAGRDPATAAIYTYVTIELTEVLRGPVADRILVLKQLGGRIGDRAMVVFGQAAFSVGEDVLVFAETRPRDRSLSTASLWQGKWQIERDAGTTARIASRRAPVRGDRGVFGQLTERRELSPLLQELRGLARAQSSPSTLGVNLDPDRSSAGLRVQAPFALFDEAGRWNEFDTGSPIPVDVQAGGQPGLESGGIPQLVNAAGLWSAATPLVFVAGDDATRCMDQAETTGHISIAFMDPCAEISNSGNTLAIGGYWCRFSGGRTLGGVSFCRNTGGFVINNDNANTVAFFAAPACFQATEAHEIGHALGLAHSTDASALMYPTISSACRTATRTLAADDVAGIRFIYPQATASAPGPPSGLVASASGSLVTLAWNAPASGGAASAYIIEAGSSAGLANLANFSTGTAATTFSASVAAGTYVVRVKATNAGGTSPASNEATLVVGGCTAAPAAPTGLNLVSNSGGTVVLSWVAASGSPSTYLVEAGSSPGLSNLANSDLGGTSISFTANGVPRGTYYVRVRARNACGTSAATSDLAVMIP